MRMGFKVYRRLEGLGYESYPAGDGAYLQWMEVYPHASYTCLLGLTPFPKHTLEGRLQRQLVLYELKMNVPDAMRVFEEITRHRLLKGILSIDSLYSPGELDALVAAYTAWVAATQPDQTLVLGDPQEGQIVLPVPVLKDRY
jgi:predicted RNase H-like nuclease